MDHQEVDSLDTKISILSDGIRKVIETSDLRNISTPFAADNSPRKIQSCKHGVPVWQRCGVCIVEDLASVLEDAGC